MSIETKSVSKKFGPVQALDQVSLCLEEGKITGLLGRNGAGKSTLLNLISNRMFPDAGEILLDGQPVRENDRVLGKMYLMSEQTCYPETMKVREAFAWTKCYYPAFDAAYAKSLAESFGLPENVKIKGLSTGYLSIFKLVTALSVNTPYVLLDEPVLGLDANHREFFYKALLEKYNEKPFTAVLSTHLIEEAAGLIENVAILKEGRLLTACPAEELLAGTYAVSGGAELVERYISGRKVLGMEAIGGLRSAYIQGRPEREKAPAELEFSQIDLQKLFILLTNS